MRPVISIVIPVLGDFERFEQGLVSVLENRPPGAEILAVFHAPYADPYALGDECRLISARRGAGLAECVQTAVNEARGEILHVLPPGATVSGGWTMAALRRLREPRVAAVAPLVVEENRPQTILSAGVDYRPGGRRIHRGRGLRHSEVGRLSAEPLGCSLVAGFWRRESWEAVGGLATDLGELWPDVDLALRMKEAGFVARFEPQSVVVAPPPARRESALAAGWHAERAYWRHAGWLSLASHAGLVMGEALSIPLRPTNSWRLAGRLAGALAAPWRRRSAAPAKKESLAKRESQAA